MINCRAVEISATSGSSATIEAGVFAYRTKGLFTTDNAIYVVDVCRPYTDIQDDFGFDYEEDSLMQTLERIAFTIPILGGLALIANCIFLCSGPPHPQIFKLLGLFYITCAILQGIGLKMMDSYICTNNPIVQYIDEVFPGDGIAFQDDCEFGMGMRLGISATVFWAIAGLLCFAVSAPEAADSTPEGLPESERDAVEQAEK
jgi:hypothetical protein